MAEQSRVHSDMPVVRQRSYWPTTHWKMTTPVAQGINPRPFVELDTYAIRNQRFHSILVVYAGKILFERYYQSKRATDYQNINSVTKSVISALMGIAHQERLIPNLDQPLLNFFTEYRSTSVDPRKQMITLRHLLSLGPGFEFEQPDPLKNLDIMSDPHKALSRPMPYEPGQRLIYDGAMLQLLSRIIARATGMSVAAYAMKKLFKPLGIWHDALGNPAPWHTDPGRVANPHPWYCWDETTPYLWSTDRAGYHIAESGLQLTSREMAKFGYLYLNAGWWEQKQIIPPAYIQDSWLPFWSDGGYGYQWWIAQTTLGQASYTAYGYGGQAIMVIPALDMVAVITSSSLETDEHVGVALNNYIIPTIAQAHRKLA